MEVLKFIKKFFASTCLYCGTAIEKSSDIFCEDCLRNLKHVKKQENNEIISVLNYEYKTVQSLILFMKDYNVKEVYKFAATLLASELQKYPDIDFSEYEITYAPRNLYTYIQKGFDQSKEIGKMLSLILFGTKKRCKSVFCTTLFAKEQKSLTGAERKVSAKKNLRKIPFVKMPKKLIIIDDITTTGSTLQTLKDLATKYGAYSCILCSIARE